MKQGMKQYMKRHDKIIFTSCKR